MKSSRTFARSAALALLAASSAALAAGEIADYTFNVPVRISSLGPGHRAEVQCQTMYDTGSSKGAGRLVSRQSASVPLDAKGNYAGTIAVRVPAGSSAVAPNRYECFLSLDGGNVQIPAKSATIRAQGAL